MKPADLVDRLAPYIHAAAIRTIGSGPDAADVAQDVWVRLLGCGRDFESWDDVRHFAMRVMHNLLTDRWRRASHRRETVYLEERTAEYHDQHPAVDCDEYIQRLRAAKLQPRDREVARLLAMGYTPEEGAAIMGMEKGAYRVVIHRMRAKLHAHG